MRTVTFKSVYESIARMHGMDPRGDAVSSDAGLSISDNLNNRVQTAWFLWEWPEWTITEERAFRQIWNDSRQFYQVGADGEPDEVFYIPNVATQSLVDAAYYRVKGDSPPIGTVPTDTTYWEPMDTVDTYVAFDQVCRRRIGEVLEVFANNPAICKPPRCLPHRVNENGIQVYEAGGLSTVFVRYLIPAEQFTTFPYIPSRTYLRGDVVYVADQGECYQAVVTASGHDPATENSYWRRCLFPAVLAQYAQLGTYADCLRESDTSDERDPVMLQIRGQRASQAASDAEDEINRQINRLQAQGQTFQYLPFGVRVAGRGGHGSICTVPAYVLQGGGAYGYGPIAPTGSWATTISDQCETPWGYIPAPTPEIPLVQGSNAGVTHLINGQNYIDVVFQVPQTNATWLLVECEVTNTVDASPLNVWPGIITNKTASGFRVQLNGIPDSGNYRLHWAISGFNAPTVPATTYLLSGPASGENGTLSAPFTVQLPSGTNVAVIVVVTPHDGGAGGTFTPGAVGLTTDSPSATFTYTPASAGAKTISVTNDGGLLNPASLTYTVIPSVHLLNTLISYWKLDEASGTRSDSQGTNHLTPVNAPVGVAGKINNGAQFVSATQQCVEITNNSSLQVTGDFTFSLWVKLVAQTAEFILIKSNSGATIDYGLQYVSGSGFEVYVNGGSGTGSAKVGASTSNGVWTHLAFWYDSGTGQIYLRINDTTTYQSTTCPALIQSTQGFGIGGSFGAGLPSDTVVDEVGFWKRKLTAPEITALYNAGAGLPFSSFTP